MTCTALAQQEVMMMIYTVLTKHLIHSNQAGDLMKYTCYYIYGICVDTRMYFD